ncbi:MAG: hypothetical protein ABIX46_07805 [Burkholderiaceae bacterium]
MPVQALDAVDRRTSRGRLKMLLVLLVCAAPVMASYLAYFVIRPSARSNYGELVEPQRPIPESLRLTDLHGVAVDPASLKGQWLVVVVAGGACDARCERLLWLQRQLREALGRDKERVDKLWLVNDSSVPRRATLDAVGAGAAGGLGSGNAAAVLRAAPQALSAWLAAAPGSTLEDHLYIVDPMGHWMMRSPALPDPSRLKRDVDRLLRASAGWDRDGR